MISVLIPKNSKIASIAAEEFASLFCAVCGEKPQIVFEDTGGDLVSLGSDAISLFAHEAIFAGWIKDFRIRSGADGYHLLSARQGDRNLLFIAGGRPRSLLYGVYRFFELKASCRWFWDGDVIPGGDAPDITGLDLSEAPHFAYRGLRYFAHRSLHRFQAEHWSLEDWKREIDWILKRRLNLFMLRIGLDDLFQRAFPDIVPYPEGFGHNEPTPHTYDDRTPFWKLSDRSKLRREILEYARERDLLHPEDFGTPTHWYSRTPSSYIEKVSPALMGQSNLSYNDITGKVWDVKDDANLEAYFKLTEAHIANYGSPAIFHTIGTGERTFYADRKKNHELKRYVYRRSLERLRQSYPDAPVLIGSWDFISTWTHDEVKEFVGELDPMRTIVLDYTSDIWDDVNTFENWGLVGKFPWIFGIFHAYEASNEIRGNYDIIRRRFPKAVDDPMCKGVVFWPENSHQDTLMLEYFTEIAWNPALYRIEDFLPVFVSRRYRECDRERMLSLWESVLPLAMQSRWGTLLMDERRYFPQREIYPDVYFNLSGWFYGTIDTVRTEYFTFVISTIGKKLPCGRRLFGELAQSGAGKEDGFVFRDVLDMARTAVARAIEYQLCLVGLLLDGWTCRTPVPEIGLGREVEKDDIFRETALTRRLGAILSMLLEASPEFSLNATLDGMHRAYETNPAFEKTLKANSDNGYCRSYIYELARYSYETVLDGVFSYIEGRVSSCERKGYINLDAEIDAIIAERRKGFDAKPLCEMKPDHAAAKARLGALFSELKEIYPVLP